GIRDATVTGVQTCALPISALALVLALCRHHARSGCIGKSVDSEHSPTHLSDCPGQRARLCGGHVSSHAALPTRDVRPPATLSARSEERRVGKECGCRVASE